MSLLHIGTPYIKRLESTSRLCSMISDGETSYEMYYEVEQCWESYLCVERADAFVAALLPYAMLHGGTIESEQALSEELYYRLTTGLIPAMSKYTKEYQPITIHAPVSAQPLPCAGKVGTGISGGVDSFYTIFHHISNELPLHNLTTLTFFNVGSHGDFGGEKARQLFLNRMVDARQNAERLGLEFVWVDSNLSEYIRLPHLATHTFRSCSVVLALQKLFGKYYFSSGHSVTDLGFSVENCGYYEWLIAESLSTEQLSIYIDGLAESRMDKVSAIQGIPYVQQHLNVCVKDSSNCSHCEKCLRTMTALYAIGKLDDFAEVFDVDDYKKHIATRLAFMLGRVRKDYYGDSYRMMKQRGVKIPFAAYLLCIPKWLKEGVRPLFNKMEGFRRIWRRLRGAH